MGSLFNTIVLTTLINSLVLFYFSKGCDIEDWKIVNDGVMGGKSARTFKLNANGFGEFSGNISLENNGGFSSVRYQFDKIITKKYSKISITIKGDGKNFQLRVKNQAGNYYSYITTFSTSGDWQVVEIQLEDMYPSFKGRKLDLPNFSHDQIEEITFLIANKKPEQSGY